MTALAKQIIIPGLMEKETGPTAFSLPSDIWEGYMKHRPNYPDSMWKTWLNYHQGPLNTAHEMGTGCGIGAAKLLTAAKARSQPIKNMMLSDPASSNIATAKQVLSRGAQFPETTFTFHQRPGEDSFLAPGSVDFAMTCICLHWMDINKAMPVIHASLRPGGTFASVYYSLATLRVRGNDAATDAWARIVECQPRGCPVVEMGMNWTPFDKGLWEDVIRTWYNVEEGKTSLPGPASGYGNSSMPPDRLDPENESYKWVQDEEWGVEGCTTGFLLEMLKTTYYTWSEKSWKDFEDAVGGSGASFDIDWFSTTFLARKKA